MIGPKSCFSVMLHIMMRFPVLAVIMAAVVLTELNMPMLQDMMYAKKDQVNREKRAAMPKADTSNAEMMVRESMRSYRDSLIKITDPRKGYHYSLIPPEEAGGLKEIVLVSHEPIRKEARSDETGGIPAKETVPGSNSLSGQRSAEPEPVFEKSNPDDQSIQPAESHEAETGSQAYQSDSTDNNGSAAENPASIIAEAVESRAEEEEKVVSGQKELNPVLVAINRELAAGTVLENPRSAGVENLPVLGWFTKAAYDDIRRLRLVDTIEEWPIVKASNELKERYKAAYYRFLLNYFKSSEIAVEAYHRGITRVIRQYSKPGKT